MTQWQNQPAPLQSAPTPAYQLAGWGIRAGAIIIDALIVTGFFIVLFIVISILGSMLSGGAESVVLGVLNLGSIGASFAYAFVLMSRKGSRNGQTWGKQICGIRAVRDNGEDFEVGSLLMRELLGKFVSGIICYIGYLWPLWDQSNRALHDIIANTHVIVVDKDGNPLAPIAYDYSAPTGYVPPAQPFAAPEQTYGAPAAPSMVKPAAPSSTLSNLSIGSQGYIATASISMDVERGCWLDPHAGVSTVSAGAHVVHVEVLGDGYYLKIPGAVAASISATDASPEGYRSNGWQAAKSIEIV